MNKGENNYENLDKKYLIRQNRNIRMELKQTKEICEMHKNALIVLSDPYVQKNTVIQTLVNLIKSSNESRRYEQMNKQIGELQSKLLVLEKIVEQAVNSEKETYNLLVDNFQKLKQDNMKKDQQLNKFYQKIGQVDYLSGLVTKYIQILSPTQQTMAFQKEQAQMLDMLNLQKQTIRKLNQEKQKLIKINVYLKDELDKKKDDIRNLTVFLDNNANGTMILDELQPEKDNSIVHTGQANRSMINANLNHSLMNKSLNNIQNHSVVSTLNFLKMQNQLIKEQNEGQGESDNQQMDCPQLALLFPDRIKLIKSARERKKVPYLNMLKVRELMVKRENKLKKQIEAANIHVNPTTKIIKLQNELDITRKELSNYMLKYRTVDQETKNNLAYIQQLEGRNSVIMQANERLTNIYKTLFQEYQVCRAVTSYLENVIGQKLIGKSISKITTVLNQFLNPIFNHKKEDTKNMSTIFFQISNISSRKRCSSVHKQLP